MRQKQRRYEVFSRVCIIITFIHEKPQTEGTLGEFSAENKTINIFELGKTDIKSVIAEESFHAFQYLFYGKEKHKELGEFTSIELEAKLFVSQITGGIAISGSEKVAAENLPGIPFPTTELAKESQTVSNYVNAIKQHKSLVDITTAKDNLRKVYAPLHDILRLNIPGYNDLKVPSEDNNFEIRAFLKTQIRK